MKYKDYYAILGVERSATADDVKKAYRKLARKYHPDVSKDPKGEEKFKDLAEAYQTLKDPEKRAAFDRLGPHATGQEFEPSRDWAHEFNTEFNGGGASFEGVDLSDLFASFSAHGRHNNRAMKGQDFHAETRISLEQAYAGATITLDLSMPSIGPNGHSLNVPTRLAVVIPRGASDGQQLRLRGKGGPGRGGGATGDLYLTVKLSAHRLYRVDGHQLYIDLPLTPWEAALGATVEVPTLAGMVNLKIAPGTMAGQHLRLAKRGLPRSSARPAGSVGDAANAEQGDLFAIVKLVMPHELSTKEISLLQQLAESSTFDPRQHFDRETSHAA